MCVAPSVLDGTRAACAWRQHPLTAHLHLLGTNTSDAQDCEQWGAMDPYATVTLTGPVPPPTASTRTAMKGGTSPQWDETLCEPPGGGGAAGACFTWLEAGLEGSWTANANARLPPTRPPALGSMQRAACHRRAGPAVGAGVQPGGALPAWVSQQEEAGAGARVVLRPAGGPGPGRAPSPPCGTSQGCQRCKQRQHILARLPLIPPACLQNRAAPDDLVGYGSVEGGCASAD